MAVQRDFVARPLSFWRGTGVRRNQLHSHHYKVEVRLEGSELDQHGYLVDIVDIEERLEELVAYYRDQSLNELKEFNGLNPSIEHLSRLFCEALADRITAPNIHTVTVRIWEKRHRLGIVPVTVRLTQNERSVRDTKNKPPGRGPENAYNYKDTENTEQERMTFFRAVQSQW